MECQALTLSETSLKHSSHGIDQFTKASACEPSKFLLKGNDNHLTFIRHKISNKVFQNKNTRDFICK